jgi:hypothetical protein
VMHSWRQAAGPEGEGCPRDAQLEAGCTHRFDTAVLRRSSVVLAHMLRASPDYVLFYELSGGATFQAGLGTDRWGPGGGGLVMSAVLTCTSMMLQS